MPAAQIALLAATVAVLGIFVGAAGLCFRSHVAEGAGIHLVKVVGPLSCGLTVVEIWRAPGIRGGSAVTGIALLALALALFLWALRAHGGRRLTRVYAADLPERLLQTGPYRWVRHPCYSAYLLAYLAAFLATLSWWLAPVFLANLALYLHAARAEERKFARSPLASLYATYRARTGMLVPNPMKILEIITK